DALRLPFADGAFDVAMSYGLLEHFDQQAISFCLQESYRVLKPGGVLVGDIVHSRFSARKVAIGLNFAASAVYHVLRGQWRRVPSLSQGYFHPFYENTLGLAEWKEYLRRNGFADVRILCIRPFPALAVTGALEKLYIRLMEAMLPFYRWFDESQSWLSRHWGWTYLFYATKPIVEGG
ncbi:MAG: methyltransferase domain-containing protein, partial [Chloroflexi bacterium]|nr:methyltransferase domain-containing protein [Chloroflexota bacterium]